VAIGIDPSESAQQLDRYKSDQGYPWPVAVANRDLLERYRVTTTSIKFALDRNGVVQYQRGYGVGSAEEWTRLLNTLVGA
jgi:hypothetical protein